MEQIRKALELNKTEYYETHLSIINCLLPVKMTPMEIKVMASFMGLEGDIARVRFGPSAKKLIMSYLNIKPAALSNHMTNMVRKGFLIERTDSIEILSILVPESNEQMYTLKLKNLGYVK